MSRSPPPARTLFAAVAFDHLRAALGENDGTPLRLALSDIDEDPRQPRTAMADAALESMAHSIRLHGVVQPIVVRPPVNGRYLLACGARRLRASRLAGLGDIPAIVRDTDGDVFAMQVMENQQREGLSNRDLAGAVARLTAEGMTIDAIAAVCCLKPYQISAYRQVDRFPPDLTARMECADMRALYDLYRQWTKTPEAVLAALPEVGTYLSITESRRIVASLTGRPTGSITEAVPVVPDATPAHHPLAADAPPAPATMPQAPCPGIHTAPAGAREGAGSAARRAPVFVVTTGGGQEGRLIVDRRAAHGGHVLVQCGASVETAALSLVQIVRVE